LQLSWLKWSIYLSMINEHIILVELSSNSFNAICGFNTKRGILMNWNVRNEWYSDKESTK